MLGDGGLLGAFSVGGISSEAEGEDAARRLECRRERSYGWALLCTFRPEPPAEISLASLRAHSSGGTMTRNGGGGCMRMGLGDGGSEEGDLERSCAALAVDCTQGRSLRG